MPAPNASVPQTLEIQTEQQKRGAFWAFNVALALNNFENVVKRAAQVAGDVADASTRSRLKAALARLEQKNAATQTKIERVVFRALPHLALVRELIELGGEKSDAKTQKNDADDAPRDRDFTSRDFYAILRHYAECLHELRNYFAHARHRLPNWPQSAVVDGVPYPSILEKALFNANIRLIKERFYASENPKVKGVVEKQFVCYRPNISQNKQIVPNPDFKFRLVEQGDAPNNDASTARYYPTKAGTAFFVARFLEKSDVERLFNTADAKGRLFLNLAKPQAPQNPELPELSQFDFSAATLRLYATNAARLPRRRVEARQCPELSDEALGLAVLEHLRRCPKTLYEYLDVKERQKLREAFDVDDRESFGGEWNASKTNPPENRFLRADRRFPYLAALCLDRTQAFERLRFQVDMGRYFSAPHRRPTIDGATLDDRRVGKQIFWFQRLQDAVAYYFAERRKPGSKYFVADGESTPPPTDYRVDAFPRYRVKNRQLGLRLVGPRNDAPELIPWDFSKRRVAKMKTERPEFWLSEYELPALLFVATNGQGAEAERVVVEYQKNWRRFLQDVVDGTFRFGASPSDEARRAFEAEYRLDARDLPDAFRERLVVPKSAPRASESKSVPPSFEERVEAVRRRLIDETRRRLQTLQTESGQIFTLGKRKTPTLKIGRVAGWLVRDFVRFQYSTRGGQNGKFKSAPDFNALQAALACFDANKDRLREILEAANLVPSTRSQERVEPFYFASATDAERPLHPFLSAVLANESNLYNWRLFYRRYLEKRLQWLEKCDPSDVYLLRRAYRRQQKRLARRDPDKRSTVARQTARRLLEEPINLPRGLFDELVRDVVRERFPEKYAEALEATRKSRPDRPAPNVFWLLDQYREWRGDEPQEFYAWSRDYMGRSKRFQTLFQLCGLSPNAARTVAPKELKTKFKENFNALFGYLFPKEKGDANATRERQKTEYAKIRQFDALLQDFRDLQRQDYVLTSAASRLLFEGDADRLFQRDAFRISTEFDETFGTARANPLRELRRFEVEVPLSTGGVCAIVGESNLKNVGSVDRFLSDVRLDSFLRSLRLAQAPNAETLEYVDLAREFAEWNQTARRRVFTAVYRFEQACFARWPNELKAAEKDGYVDFYTILKTAFPNDLASQAALLVIRNKFAHGEYPIFELPKSASSKERATLSELYPVWNREMWSGYDPKRRPLCQCVADWAVALFKSKREEIEARRAR